jgi:4-diphosphocytidyl-2C-methyl-D-erythritol kinase
LCLLLSEGSWGTNRGFNDFESLICRRFPRIREACQILLEHGALAAQLSGSGSAVFGIFSDRNKARKALSRIEQHLWKAYLAKMVDQASYKRALSSIAPSVNPAHLGLSALH